ncbi:MAG: SEL1-like repeat protein [Gammaproteobacteria bacterium]|nr:SEL1-like repeat protein [Gammaproteobacteria bacterium]
MHKKIFTTKYTLFLVSLLLVSWAIGYILIPTKNQPAGSDVNAKIDAALQYNLNGNYIESVKILYPLAEKEIPRAQLYLGVAYYHGHGVNRDYDKAKALFFKLQNTNYEPSIVNTYLNLLGSL